MRMLTATLPMLGFLLACSATPQEPLTPATPDRVAFETQAYPVLLRDCGFHACHGSRERFFQVVGPGRLRLGVDTRPLDAPTAEEIELSFQRARSMIDASAPEKSLLLRKPLSRVAGGAGHQGVDHFGRDVYSTKLAPGYVAIEQWVRATPTASP